MRSLKYDALKHQLRTLAGNILSITNTLQKSKQENSLLSNIQTVIEHTHLSKDLADEINKSWDCLQDDFVGGRINLVRYRKHLQQVSEFFNTDVQKVDIPPNLKTMEMLQAIAKYL